MTPDRWVWVSGYLALALLICSCAVGGGSGTANKNAKLGGIWIGTAMSDITPGEIHSVTAISTDDGDFRLISYSGNQYVGTISSNGNELSGNLAAYAPADRVFANGQAKSLGSISGEIVERRALRGEWYSLLGDHGKFELSYHDLHTLDSSFAKIAGTYTGFDPAEIAGWTSTIVSDGGYFGQDDWGCTRFGQLRIIDPQFNVYAWNDTVSNCGGCSGVYVDGLGFFDPEDNSFTGQIDNGICIGSGTEYR